MCSPYFTEGRILTVINWSMILIQFTENCTAPRPIFWIDLGCASADSKNRSRRCAIFRESIKTLINFFSIQTRPHATFTKMRTVQRSLFADRRWVGTGVGRNPCTRMRARLVSPYSDELATKDVLVHLIVFVACRCMCRLLARIVSTYCFHVLDGIDRHHLYRSIDDAWRKSCTHVVGKDRRQRGKINQLQNQPPIQIKAMVCVHQIRVVDHPVTPLHCRS